MRLWPLSCPTSSRAGLPQTVSAEATLAGLPLALLGRFGGPPLVGEAGARLQLSGAGDNPRARSEHVFQYPLPEALAAVESLLAQRDFDALPFKDGTHLLSPASRP